MIACATRILGGAIMTDLLTLERVVAGYAGTEVLDGVSVSLGEGAALAVLGRNGTGKTTLISTILGLTDQISGTVRFKGRDISAIDTHLRALSGIALVPQEREIFPSLTVDENLRIATKSGEWTVARIYEFFPSLARRRANLGHKLSGGEQQMLALGRALVGNPELLLLDEPFEGLAPVIVDQIAEMLIRIRAESRFAMILVEHHAELALEMTDHAIVLDRGSVVWSGVSEKLLSERELLAGLIGVG
jgi:branched-chain amino acid transport system ATP-binding protein